MKRFFFLLNLILCISANAQDPWVLKAESIDPTNYYGVTIGNGMIGMRSSAVPLQIDQVIIAGLYDYGRSRVVSAMPNINPLQLRMAIDYEDINTHSVSDFTQGLELRNGAFTGHFSFKNKAKVSYTYYALRHLPHTLLLDISITPLRDITLLAENILTTPEGFRNPQNTVTLPKYCTK